MISIYDASFSREKKNAAEGESLQLLSVTNRLNTLYRDHAVCKAGCS